MTIRISGLFIYPVKSLAGMALQSAQLSCTGLRYDRQWMVVDEQGLFMSQRKQPVMATISTALDAQGGLSLHCNGDSMDVPEPCGTKRVTVWNDEGEALAMPAEVDAWLSHRLGRSCHLVRMPERSFRHAKPGFGADDATIGFADAFPLLAIAQSSLDQLNQALQDKSHTPVSMPHFRPNIVIEGCSAHQEDTWKEVQIGAIALRNAKLCNRCIMINVDPATGERAQSEPLKTLAGYRTKSNQVYLGVNWVHTQLGKLNVGDEVIAIA